MPAKSYNLILNSTNKRGCSTYRGVESNKLSPSIQKGGMLNRVGIFSGVFLYFQFPYGLLQIKIKSFRAKRSFTARWQKRSLNKQFRNSNPIEKVQDRRKEFSWTSEKRKKNTKYRQNLFASKCTLSKRISRINSLWKYLQKCEKIMLFLF